MQYFIDHTPQADGGNCNPCDGTQGQAGVTIWGPRTTPIVIPSNQTSDKIYFSMTHPKCIDYTWPPTYPPPPDYHTPTKVCNVTFTISTDSDTSGADVGPIWMGINADPDPNVQSPYDPYHQSSPRYHSRLSSVSGVSHDITETHDIAVKRDDFGQLVLKDFGTNDPLRSGINYLRFTNYSDVQVRIKDLRIIREYQMSYLPTEEAGQCKPESSRPTQPDFAERIDFPCARYHCGHMSVSDWDHDDSVVTIAAGSIESWTWRNPGNPSNNYLAPKNCIFNFNNVTLIDQADAVDQDVKFSIKVNNSEWVDFYHTGVGSHHMAHSVDLATHPVLSQGYDDNPLAINTLQLRVDPYTRVDGLPSKGFYLWDGYNDVPSDPGRVNIYRVYQTVNLCDTKTITVNQTTGGTISPGTTEVMAYEDQNFTITPQPGYTLEHVYVDGDDKGPITSYSFNCIAHDHTISAYFGGGQRYLTITYDATRGTVDHSSGYYDYYSYQWITATANSGYMIHSWIIDGNEYAVNSVQDTQLVTMWSDRTVTINFVPVQATSSVTLKAISMCSGVTLPANIYVDGPTPVGTGEVTLTLNNGYHAIYWDPGGWNEQYSTYSILYEISDGLGNGESRYIGADITITAIYYP